MNWNPWGDEVGQNVINIHMGMPKLVPSLIQNLRGYRRDGGDTDSYVVTPREYRRYIRSLISSNNNSFVDLAALEADLSGFLVGLNGYKAVSISQHNMLGEASDFFCEKPFPRADARIKKLISLLGGREISLHICIQDQYQYLSKIAAHKYFFAANEGLLEFGVPSWSRVVSRIKREIPHHKLFVWDFECLFPVSIFFAASILGVPDIESYDFEIAMQREMSALSHPGGGALNVPYKLLEEMDLQYEVDLYEISRMEGVNLIRPSDLR